MFITGVTQKMPKNSPLDLDVALFLRLPVLGLGGTILLGVANPEGLANLLMAVGALGLERAAWLSGSSSSLSSGVAGPANSTGETQPFSKLAEK